MERKLSVSAGFCIGLALALLLLPLPWLLACGIAAVFHELCHYFAIRLCTGRQSSVHIQTFAARMPLPEMSRGKELFCALAGPLGGLSLLLLSKWMPRVAICAAIHSAYNLLPVYPLDGGRALQCGLSLFLPPPVTAKLCHIVEIVCKTGIAILAIYGCFWLRLGVFPLLMAAVLLLRIK